MYKTPRLAHLVEKISCAITEEFWLNVVVHIVKEMSLFVMHGLNILVVYYCTHFDAIVVVVQIPSRCMTLLECEK